MRLKTINDLWDEHLEENPDSRRALEFRDRIEKEAIRWIKKEIRVALKECNEPHNKANIKWIIKGNSERIKTWIDRFNITEENLKIKPLNKKQQEMIDSLGKLTPLGGIRRCQKRT